jgi:hypothetical protein
MGTNTAAARTYTPVPWAVLPGAAARGFVLSLVYMPMSMLAFWYLTESLGGTAIGPTVDQVDQTLGLGGVALIGFLVAFVGSVVLALIGFGQRTYELGDEGITETRGILFSKERFFPYDDIEEVTHMQSQLQSWYGSGTIHVSEVEEDADQERTIRFEYIRSPGAVYTNILRNIADVTGATEGHLDDIDIEELQDRSGDISRLSGDSLAAGTGFRYLMPSAVLHPSPSHAAQDGMLVGLVHSAIAGAVVYYFRSFFVDLFGLPSLLHLFAGFGAVALAYTLARGGWYYWQYDKVQYELYDDHIRFITDEERVSVSVDDVVGLDPHQDHVKWNNGGHIGLLDGDGNELRAFRFVPNFESVAAELEAWATGSAGADKPPEDAEDTEAIEEPPMGDVEQSAQETTDQSRQGDTDQQAQ